MATIILSIVLFGVVMAGMAIGLIFQGKTIKGSCGGMSALGMGTACDICGGDTRKCEEETRENEASLKNAEPPTGQLSSAGKGGVKNGIKEAIKGGFYEA